LKYGTTSATASTWPAAAGTGQENELVINKNLADTGLVPFKSALPVGTFAELGSLKGLKDEDREQVLLYDR
jgi:hypothetical protein